MGAHGSHDFLGALVNYPRVRFPPMPSAPRVSSERASTILREVPQKEAFHFYSAIDKPLNVSARSLKEFLERIATVEPASLDFHSNRRDFESWVTMLGDDELSRKFAGVRASRLRDEALRTKLYNTTKNRLVQLSQFGTGSR